MTIQYVRRLVVAALICLPGCKEEKVQASRPATSSVASAVPVKPGTTPVAVPTKDVEALLEQWREAQNSGALPAYSNLYAQGFVGVKRSDARVRRFKREQWLQDRAAMFQKPMHVEYTDLKITSSPAMAIATFTQTWKSGTYNDIGPKEMLLTLQGGQLRILKEEMLASRAAGTDRKYSPPNFNEFMFAKPLTGGYALIVRQGVDLNLVTAHPAYAPDSGHGEWASERPHLDTGVSEEIRALRGKRFDLYGKDRKLCTVTVDSFIAYTEVIPGGGWYGPDTAQPTNEAVALGSWTMAQQRGEGSYLAAKGAAGAQCAGAIWARSADLPEPALFSAREPSADEQALVLDRFQELVGFKQIQETFERGIGTDYDPAGVKGKHWYQYYGGTALLLFENLATHETFASASAEAGGCADRVGEYWAFFRTVGSKFNLLSDPFDPLQGRIELGVYVPEIAFDLNNDGRPELVGSAELFEFRDGTYVRTSSAIPPFLGCPC